MKTKFGLILLVTVLIPTAGMGILSYRLRQSTESITRANAQYAELVKQHDELKKRFAEGSEWISRHTDDVHLLYVYDPAKNVWDRLQPSYAEPLRRRCVVGMFPHENQKHPGPLYGKGL